MTFSLDELILGEKERQCESLQLVASENLPTIAVQKTLSHSFLNWKTIEGRRGSRYHGGCEFFDEIEHQAIRNAQALFDVEHVLVQPNSASVANAAVGRFLATLGKAAVFSPRSGGHISHQKVFSNVHILEVSRSDFRIDYSEIEDVLARENVRVLVVGGSSYPRSIAFEHLNRMCVRTGTVLWADCAHLAGLMAGGVHPSAAEWCDVVTGSTYKTLRGPRSGFIMFGKNCDAKLGTQFRREIETALSPGVQSSSSGVLLAAKAVCFLEAHEATFATYSKKVVANARALSEQLMKQGVPVLTSGTDTHIVMCDVGQLGITGLEAQTALEHCNIVVNKNLIPYDNRSPSETSGLRMGSQFLTSRGLEEKDFERLGGIVADVLFSLANRTSGDVVSALSSYKEQIAAIGRRYPIDPLLFS